MSRLIKPRRRGLPLLAMLSLAMLLAALGLLIYELLSFSQRESRLPAGITVAGVRVGNLTIEQAQAAVEEVYTAPVTLYYQGNPINLNPDSVGFRLSTDSMFAAASAAGEAGGGFWERFVRYLLGQEETAVRDISLVADYQTTALRAELEDIARRYDQPGTGSGYDVQTLTTFGSGTGFVMNVDAALSDIDAALRRPENRSAELPVIEGSSGARPGMEMLGTLIKEYLNTKGFLYDGQTTIASIFILDLETGEEINILGDVAFTAASTAKVGILIDYFRILDAPPNNDDAFLMANSILCSSNGASNNILRLMLGAGDIMRGLQSVTETEQHIGARNTYITAPFIEIAGQQFGSNQPPAISPNPNYSTEPDYFNQTTAEDLGTMFSLIYDCAYHRTGLMSIYPGGEFTQQECSQMLELMSGLELNRLLQGGIPPGVRIAHKNGWVGEITGNAGIVFPPNGHNYVISVFLWQKTSSGFQDYTQLWPLIEDISRAAWNYFSPEQALLTARQDIPASAQECVTHDSAGNISQYIYLPPHGQVNLDDIDAWRTR
jgi:beta-lactamase class A